MKKKAYFVLDKRSLGKLALVPGRIEGLEVLDDSVFFRVEWTLADGRLLESFELVNGSGYTVAGPELVRQMIDEGEWFDSTSDEVLAKWNS